MSNDKKQSLLPLSKRLNAKLKDTKNESFDKKNPLGYIDKSKPIKDYYVRIFALSGIIIFFVVNMVIAYFRYTTIPESRYYLATMDGMLHEIKPQDKTKLELSKIKKAHEAKDGN